MAKRKKSATVAAEKWAQNIARSAVNFEAGVDAVDDSPLAKAVERASHWQEQVSSREAKERFISGLQRVSLADWKKAMKEKGGPRARAGAALAQPKMQRFLAFWIDKMQDIVREVDSVVPRGSLDDNLRRADMVARAAAGLRGDGKAAARGR